MRREIAGLLNREDIEKYMILCYNKSKKGGESMNKRFSFPKRYWIYIGVVFVCGVLLIGNILRTDSWTGDKPFSEFAQRDWQLFLLFLIEEMIIFAVMFLFAFLGHRIGEKREIAITAQWEKDKYLGIKPGDYNYIWFDFANTERALISKQGDLFKLYVQEYDEHTGNWLSFNGVSIYESLEEIKKALYFEYDFYCEENTELDKYGNETFVGEINIPISSIQGISPEEISFVNAQGYISEILFADIYRYWCKKHYAIKSNLRYVCDKTRIDGERRIIFYGNPSIIVVANKEQEDLWFEMIEKMKTFGYFAFDID